MNNEQVAAVVAKIKLGDNREVTQLVLREWSDSIAFLDFDDAILAVTMHRRESTEYLQPAHIIANVKRIRQDRTSRAEVETGVEQVGAPRPANWDAMVAAWNDPVEYAKQRAIYSQQLVDAGYPPLYERGWADERGV